MKAVGRYGRRAGTSLLEMLVVLTILGVIAGAVAPAIRRSVTETKAETVRRQITMLVDRARITAIRRGAATVLTLDPLREKYWMVRNATTGDSIIAGGELGLPDGVRLESPAPRPSLRFAPSGQLVVTDAIVVRASDGAIVLSSIQWRGSGFSRAK